MVKRLVNKGQIENNRIELVDLKDKLEAILEVNEEGEGDVNNDYKQNLTNYQHQPITQAQLAAYEKLLQKLSKDQENADTKTSPGSETGSALWTLASTANNKGHTFYSVRKVKDYLQKKAKEAKVIENNEIKAREQEAVKKMVEEEKLKPKKKLQNLFSPLLAIDIVSEGNISYSNLLETSSQNAKAKENFMKRVQELTNKEIDPLKNKSKMLEKVQMMAVEKYLRDVEEQAKEDKRLAVQQRPLNEEIVQKQLSQGLVSKLNMTKCDL